VIAGEAGGSHIFPKHVPRAWRAQVEGPETDMEDNSLQRASPQPTKAVLTVPSIHVAGVCPGPLCGM